MNNSVFYRVRVIAIVIKWTSVLGGTEAFMPSSIFRGGILL